MATCKWCEKSGFLLRVNDTGVCGTCKDVIALDVLEIRRLAKDSVDLVEKSKVLDTRLSRLDFVSELFGRLLKYEAKGISVIDPIPSKMIEDTITWRNQILKHDMDMRWAIAFPDSFTAKTQAARLRVLTKFMDKLQVYHEKYPGAGLDSLIGSVKDRMEEVTSPGSDN